MQDSFPAAGTKPSRCAWPPALRAIVSPRVRSERFLSQSVRWKHRGTDNGATTAHLGL